MRKSVWANTDSRVEGIIDHGEVMLTVVYEGTETTDELTVYIPVNEFFALVANMRGNYMLEEGRWP